MREDNTKQKEREEQADNLKIPVMNVCNRCGKIFFDSLWHAYYICDKCKNKEALCRECQQNINCYCGEVMRLYYDSKYENI